MFTSVRASRPSAMRARAHYRKIMTKASAQKESIQFEDLVEVIRAVDASDLIEMELTGKKFSVNVKKQEALEPVEPIYMPQPMAAAPAPAAAAPAPAAPAAPAKPPPAAPAPAADAGSGSGVEMLAPMSGTVYRKPAPGEPQFAKEGDQVVVGQTVCIIEAMKLMNEIEADTSGTLVKFVATDAKPVNPGDVLCIIEP